MTYHTNKDIFRIESTPVEVTSLHRPDTSWRFVDKAGHEHRWWEGLGLAIQYRPTSQYYVDTVKKVVDGWYYDEDGEPFARWHYECDQCGDKVEPGYCADTHTQYIPGIKRCYINDVLVTPEEFERRLKEAQK